MTPAAPTLAPETTPFNPAAPEAEQIAWSAGLALSNPPENFDTPLTDGRTPRQIATDTYRSYYEHRTGRGLQPFPTIQRQATKQRDEEFRKAYSGLDQLEQNLRPEQYQQLDIASKDAPDPAEYKARAINANFLEAVTGRKIDPADFSTVRDAYADQVLGIKGPVTDKIFYETVRTRHQEDQQAASAFSTHLEGILSKRLATIGKVETGTPTPTNAEIKGFDRPAPKSLEYKPDLAERDAFLATVPERLRENYRQQWNDSNRELSRLFRTHAPLVEQIVRSVEQTATGQFGDQEKIIWDDATKWADSLPQNPKDRAIVLTMLGNALDNLPPDTRSTGIRIASAAARGVNLAIDTNKQALIAEGRQTFGKLSEGTDVLKQDTADFLTRRRELLDVLQGNGLKLSNLSDNIIQQSGIAAASSAWMIPASLNPIGQVAIVQSMAGQSVQDQAIKNPTAPESVRTNTAFASGLAQGALEILSDTTGVKILMGKLPTFTSLLNKTGLTNPVARGILGAATGYAATTGIEYTEEALQGATDQYFQSLAADLTANNPKIDWQNYFKQWLTVAGPEQRETLLAVSAFGMIAGAGAGFHHFKNGSAIQNDKRLMRAIGFDETQIRDVITTEDPQAAAQKAAAYFDLAQARAKDPAEAAHQENLRKEYIATLRAQNEALQAAGLPRVVKERNDFTEEDQFVFIDPADNSRKSFDTEEQALEAFGNWKSTQDEANLDTIRTEAENHYLDHLTSEGQQGENIDVQRIDKTRSLATVQSELQTQQQTAEADLRKASTAVQERRAKEQLGAIQQKLAWLNSRIKVFLFDEGIPAAKAGEALKSARILGETFATKVMDRIAGYTVRLYRGADLATIAEEFSEANIRDAIDNGFVDPEILLDNIRRYESTSGNAVIDPAYEWDPENPIPVLEGFSKLARGYMLSQVRAGLLPPTVARWIEMQTALQAATIEAGTAFAADIKTAAELRAAITAGQLPGRLEAQIKDAIGLDPAAQERRLQKQMEDQLAAEAMDGFPEIQDEARGRLPHPETLRENSHPLYGEIRRLWDSLKKPTKRRTKAGKAIDRTNEANAYFLPIGEMADLDDVRQSLNERGFAFETITDLIDALDASISYGKPFYGTASAMEDSASSFSLATLSQQDIQKLKDLGEDGFISAVNQSGKWHSSDSYDTTANRLASYIKYEAYDELISTVDGVEYRVENRPIQYTAVDSSGEIIRDESGMAKYFTVQEMKDRGLKTAMRDMAAFINKHPVGIAQDEWGAVLVMVAKEYRGKGIGPHLASYYRTENPFKDSGGFTTAGENQARKVYRYLVGESPLKSTGSEIGLLHSPINKETIEISDVYVVDMRYPEWSRRVYWKYNGEEFWTETTADTLKNTSPELIAKEEMARILIYREEQGKSSPSYSLTTRGVLSLDAAIAKRMTRGPDERADFFEKLRNRLAATVLQLREAKRNVAIDATEAERERNRIQDALAEARAIIDALPAEARGRVPFNVADILDATTERGQINALIRLIDKADEALETVLLKEYRDAFEILLDLAKPDLRQNKQIRGRLTPATQKLVGKIYDATILSPEELAARLVANQSAIDALEASTPATPEEIKAAQEQLIDLTQDQTILETFGAFSRLDAAGTARAYEQLQSIYATGRTARRILDEARKAELDAKKRELLDSLPIVTSDRHTKRVADKGWKDFLESFRLGMSSFHQVMETLFPKSTVARDFQEQVRKADRAFVRAKIDAKERWDAFTFGVWNLTGRSRSRQRNQILAELSTLREDWNIQLAEGISFATEKLTEEQADAILKGTMKTGWETDRIAMTSLAQALADFRMQRLKAQNEDKRFTATVIRFQRLKGRGTPAPFIASDMQALYYLQLWDQEQYRPALDKHGLTAEVMDKIRLKLSPKAADIADFLRDEYDAEWDRLNPVYRAIYGLDMPRIRNYAPGLFEHLDAKGPGTDSTIDPTGQPAAVNAMSAGFTKARTHHMARPRLTNAMAAYWSHLEATEYFIAYAEILRDARQIFRNPELRRRIEGIHGSSVAKLFSQWLDALEVDGNFRAVELESLSRIAHNVLATQSAAGLAYNIGVLMKQASASFGFLMEMPTRDALAGIALAFRNPSTLRHVWNSESVQQRILTGISPEDRKLLDAAKASPSLIMELLEIGRLPIAYADAAFTTLSASVAYAFHHNQAIKAGLSPTAAETTALAAADRVITRTAQPATTQDKSMAEITAKTWGKFFFMFKSDPRQKLAIVAQALADIRDGKPGARAAATRKVLFGWVFYGLANEVMTDVWAAMSRDDDDPERWAWNDYLAAMIAGPVNAIPILGQTLEYIDRGLIGTKAYVNSPNPVDAITRVPATASKLAKQMAEDDIQVNDVLTASQQLTSAFAAAAGAVDPRFAIVPAALRATRDAAGLVTNFSHLFTEPTEDDTRLEIVREFAAQDKTTRTGTKERNDKLAADLLKLPAPERAKAITKLDKDTRTAITRRLRAAEMTSSEAALARLSADTRKAAIEKLAATMTPQEKTAFIDRLRHLGLAD